MNLADRVDPDPTRQAVRLAWAADDTSTLRELATPDRLDALQAPTLILLAGILSRTTGADEAITILRRGQLLHPHDVWIHFELAGLLGRQGPEGRTEAVVHYRIARALHPGTGHDLAHRLEDRGQSEEAESILRELANLHPDSPRDLGCLGQILQDNGKVAEATIVLEKALVIAKSTADEDQEDLEAHFHLGLVLKTLGRHEEALESFDRAIALQPDLAESYNNRGNVLKTLGRHEEALESFDRAIALQPDYAEAHYNRGVVLRELGRFEEALESYDRALALQPDYAEVHCNRGYVLRTLGRFTEALASMEQGHELGSKQPGWPYPSARWVEECRRLVELDSRLDAIRLGMDRPTDAGELRALAGHCYVKGQFSESFTYWTEAFAASPDLADDLASGHRYNAACSAILAAAGKDVEDPEPDSDRRSAWRRQAFDWLRADLDAWEPQASSPSQSIRDPALKFRHWQADSDLASVREPEALAALPEDERTDWEALWAEVEALIQQAEAAQISQDSPAEDEL